VRHRYWPDNLTYRRDVPSSIATIVTLKLAKSDEFRVGAEVLESADMHDAAVSLAASAAINAGDVIQLIATGEIRQGQDHAQAASSLRKAGHVRAASNLSYCLSVKSKAQYASKRCTASESKKALLRAQRIFDQAREMAIEKGYVRE